MHVSSVGKPAKLCSSTVSWHPEQSAPAAMCLAWSKAIGCRTVAGLAATAAPPAIRSTSATTIQELLMRVLEEASAAPSTRRGRTARRPACDDGYQWGVCSRRRQSNRYAQCCHQAPLHCARTAYRL